MAAAAVVEVAAAALLVAPPQPPQRTAAQRFSSVATAQQAMQCGRGVGNGGGNDVVASGGFGYRVCPSAWQ